MVVHGADALGLKVEVGLDEAVAEGGGSPPTQLAEGHLQQDAVTRRDQLHIRQAVRHRLTVRPD